MQTNGTIDSLEINPHISGQLIFDKEPKTYNGERKASLINYVGKIGKPHA